jgi:hypothetical protein
MRLTHLGGGDLGVHARDEAVEGVAVRRGPGSVRVHQHLCEDEEEVWESRGMEV